MTDVREEISGLGADSVVSGRRALWRPNLGNETSVSQEPQKMNEATPAVAGRPSRDRRVTLADGYTVTMRPLPPDKITSMAVFFDAVKELHAKGISPIQVFASAKDAMVDLLRECMPDESDGTTFDLADIPFLMKAFYEQNWNEGTIKAWEDLNKQMEKLVPLATEKKE